MQDCQAEEVLIYSMILMVLQPQKQFQEHSPMAQYL